MRKDLENALKTSKSFTFLHKKELAKVEKMLSKDEDVLCASISNVKYDYSGGSIKVNTASIKNKTVGTFVATNKRVFHYCGINNAEAFKEISLKDILNVEYATNYLGSVLRISSFAITMEVDFTKNYAINAATIINKAREQYKQQETKNIETGVTTQTPAERLKDLKGLLEIGAISQTEYDYKKDELLKLI